MTPLLFALVLAATPAHDNDDAIRFVDAAMPALGASAAGVFVGTVVGVGTTVALAGVGVRDVPIVLGLGVVAGTGVGWILTSLILGNILDDSWPGWVAIATGGTVVVGTAAGLVVGGAASFFYFVRGSDDCCNPAVFAAPAFLAATGFVLGALGPTTFAALSE